MKVGKRLGKCDGVREGTSVGKREGEAVPCVGPSDGDLEGSRLGERDGGVLGSLLGAGVENEGAAEGIAIEHPESSTQLRVRLDSRLPPW